MFKNYFKTAFRNFRRNKVNFIINLLSLCIGISCCILIYTYVQHELSYDKFFDNTSQIYRMEYNFSYAGNKKTRYANINQYVNPGPLASISGVKKQTRFTAFFNVFVKTNSKKITESNFWAADSSFFNLFDFPLLKGNKKTLLSQPNSIVLTRKTARKYFSNHKALGKTLTLIFQKERIPVTVTGVINLPSNTHLQFGAVASKDVYYRLYHYHLSEAYVAYNYLQLDKGTNPSKIEKELKPLHKNADTPFTHYHLKPLTDIHLYSHVRNELGPNSNTRYIWFLSAIAIILLIIAGINFTSLATAQNLQRYKEAGIRKVMGAHKTQLIGQFLFESVCMSFFALVASYLIIYFILPYFDEFAGVSFLFADFIDTPSLAIFTGLSIGMGILAGFYPAVLLSAFQPVKTLKGISPSGKKGSSIWQSIVTFQFAISIAMIICTLTIFRQLRYIQHKNLGFNKDRILTMANTLGPRYGPLKSRLQNISGVKNVSISSYIPGVSKTSGTALIQLPDRSDSLTFNWISVDYNYFDTYDIKLKKGRLFSKDRGTDSTQAFAVNEAAVKALGWKSPLGKRINSFGRTGKVIGVTQNFNFLSLYQKVPPIVFLIDKSLYFNISVEIASRADVSGTINQVRHAWQNVLPNTPFAYKFVDQQFDALYKSDRQMGRIFGVFAILALLISCLGLFSLSSFMAAKKRKEIGVRKVLGASVKNVLLSFYKNYGILVAMACLPAIPGSYLFLRYWLQNFAFRIRMPIEIFVLAVLATLLIALAAVSYETIKAAITNPVDTLKSE